MIGIASDCLRHIVAEAEAAYPSECCGLLVGSRDSEGRIALRRAVSSPNMAIGRLGDRFEVDPKIRFDLMRELCGGPERLIGHYHSHPDGSAQPSATDLEMAFEPDLVWVIIGVVDGTAKQTAAFLVDPSERRFRAVPLQPFGE